MLITLVVLKKREVPFHPISFPRQLQFNGATLHFSLEARHLRLPFFTDALVHAVSKASVDVDVVPSAYATAVISAIATDVIFYSTHAHSQHLLRAGQLGIERFNVLGVLTSSECQQIHQPALTTSIRPGEELVLSMPCHSRLCFWNYAVDHGIRSCRRC